MGSSTQHGLNGKLHLGDYLKDQARSKIGKFRRNYAANSIAFVPAILSVAGKIHLKSCVSYGCWRTCRPLRDMETIEYLNLAGDKKDIGNERFKNERFKNERFKCSRPSAFSYNKNALGVAVAEGLETYGFLEFWCLN